MPGLLDRLKIGCMPSLKNRMVLAPLFYDWAFGSRSFQKFFETRARGGVSMVLVPVPTHGGLADLEKSDFITKSKDLLRAMHSLDCRVVPQIFSGDGESANSIPSADLDSLPEEFARAARVLEEIGYDGMEIHGAHHSLFMSLVSPVINSRSDDYGGSEENRFRLPLRTIRAIKSTASLPILYRLSAVDFVENGFDLMQSTKLAVQLEQAGIDCIDVSAGGTAVSPLYSDAPGEDFNEGCFAEYAEAIKRKIKVPVIVAGRINSKETAENIISSNQADMVALGRILVKNPSWPREVAREVAALS